MKWIRSTLKIIVLVPLAVIVNFFFGPQTILMANDMTKKRDIGAMEYSKLERI